MVCKKDYQKTLCGTDTLQGCRRFRKKLTYCVSKAKYGFLKTRKGRKVLWQHDSPKRLLAIYGFKISNHSFENINSVVLLFGG